MNRLPQRIRAVGGERGQMVAIAAVVVTGLLGMTAFVLDIGSWFREHRRVQAVADASALAGAQKLPLDTGGAQTLAIDYAGRNSGSANVQSGDVTFETKYEGNDTIVVKAHSAASGFFSKIFGIDSVGVAASAKARASAPAAAKYVAPIAVDRDHPMLSCNPPPCGDGTDLVMINLKGEGSSNASGNFTLLDLRPGGNGAPGNDELAEWMTKGYDEMMPLGTYEGAPGAKFNGNQFQGALESMFGKEVLLPVYQTPILESGSNASFNIIGWVGFVPEGTSGGGSSAQVYGHFTRFIAQGLPATTSSPANDFGVRVVSLVE